MDPLAHGPYVLEAILAQLGISERVVRREHFRSALWYARVLALAGYREASATFLAEATRQSVLLGRKDFARALATRSAIASARGSGVRARVLRLSAATLDPRGRPRRVRP